MATAMAETAVTHVAIDAHPPGDHGVSHDLPFMSHGAAGERDASVTASGTAPAACRVAGAAACIACAVAMFAMDPDDAIDCAPCIRHSVPLATSESWSSSALESTAVRR